MHLKSHDEHLKFKIEKSKNLIKFYVRKTTKLYYFLISYFNKFIKIKK